MFPDIRMRRSRLNEPMRRLGTETSLSADDLILPLFITGGRNKRREIPSMPGVYRISVDLIAEELDGYEGTAVLLFGVPEAEEKDDKATAALDGEGPVCRAVQKIKRDFPRTAVITDVCLCAYTDHGHCGILDENGLADNDRTLPLLARVAVGHGMAGADMVAPSAMMDGQAGAVRQELDDAGLVHTAIMSYAAKFASCFYGPFRDVAESAPAFGDRRSYQLPPGNRREAVRDALLDEGEGADWLMVKPAMPYLDVLCDLKAETRLPIAAYQVSGEYAMLKHAAACGVFKERDAVLESLLSIKRAGADAIISYFSKQVLKWLEP